MKQLFEEKELIGLTITKSFFDDSERLVLVFGKEFCIIDREAWSDEGAEIVQEEYKKPNAYNIKLLTQIGIITESEAKKIVLEFQNENDSLKKKNDLKKLAELKAQYE